MEKLEALYGQGYEEALERLPALKVRLAATAATGLKSSGSPVDEYARIDRRGV